MSLELLGPIRPFKGAEVAEPGCWLVVLQHNEAISLYSRGAKIRRLFHAPVLGSSVALLDTTPQEVIVGIRDVRSSEGYRLPEVTVRMHVRLAPEKLGAEDALLERINREGWKFFDSVEARIRQQVESHLRRTLGLERARGIIDEGPMAIVFPDGNMTFSDIPFVEVTAIQGVDWSEASLFREVRLAEEKEVADQAKEELERNERERTAKAASHKQSLDAQLAFSQQTIDSDLDSRRLQDALSKARTLGIDPTAIAEPDIWKQMTEQHSSVVIKLLESPHLFPMMRSSPALLSAILDRLSGGTSPLPLGRQADMVLDGLDGSRIAAGPAVAHTQSDSAALLMKSGLLVDPLIEQVWRTTGASIELTGAGLAVAPGKPWAVVLLLGQSEPSIPPTFKERLIERLNESGRSIERVGVKTASGATLADAIQQFVQKIAPSVSTSVILRQVNGRREAFVEVHGNTMDANQVFRIMTDPANPILPGLESLIGHQALIRFAPPVAIS